MDGSRQRYLFPRRFLCRHFSILSLFSRASGLAEAGRATGIPRCCAQPSTLGSELSAATAARPTIVPSLFTASQSVRACRLSCTAASVIHLYHLSRVSTLSSSSISIYQPTRYHSTLHANIKRHSPLASANPRSRTLGSETRHPRTDKPARVARCCCALLDSICFNGHLITPAYIHLPATNICCIIARSLPYMQQVLLALT